MSFSLYLIHVPLLDVAGRIIRAYIRPGWGFFLGFPLLGVIISISWILFATVERPALNYYSRKRRRKPHGLNFRSEISTVVQSAEGPVSYDN